MIILDELKYSESDNDRILFNLDELMKPTGGLYAQKMCAAIARGQKEVSLDVNCSYAILGFLCRLLLIAQPFLTGVKIETDDFSEDDFMIGFKLIEDPDKLMTTVGYWDDYLYKLKVQLVDQSVSK